MKEIRGYIFDMDGTLIEPAIEFLAMREALGLPQGDILLELARWPEEKRAWAFDIIEEIEAQAAQKMQATAGITGFLERARAAGIRQGLVTRNTLARVVQCEALLGVTFDPSIDRTYSPLKPDPASLLDIAAQWGLEPAEVVMFGDSSHDLDAAHAAGMRCVIVAREYNQKLRERADWFVRDFCELSLQQAK